MGRGAFVVYCVVCVGSVIVVACFVLQIGVMLCAICIAHCIVYRLLLLVICEWFDLCHCVLCCLSYIV